MLKVNRLRVEIHTANGLYGIDKRFQDGLNFIDSHENTCGKSSIVAAIYYCLGFEQIIGGTGGVGSKVLTSVFKSTIEDNGKPWRVTESGAYLEICNGNEIRTLYRNIKSEYKDNHLVTVYFGDYDSIGDYKTISQDYYVNFIDSATNKKGFHTFLEEYLHMEIPLVRTSDGKERKLYLQMIFASMFIEQKHGWSDILSGMPVFGIRESKKRVIEYILGLDVLKNERERDRLKNVKVRIENKWSQLTSNLQRLAYSESCEITHIPLRPTVLSSNDCSRFIIVSLHSSLPIDEEIKALKTEYERLRQLKPRVIENFKELNDELSETQQQILSFENYLKELQNSIVCHNEAIKRLISDLVVINSDIRNNKDAARLQKFGSEITGYDISANTCPVCKQHIQDNLLNAETASKSMSIEENISHLEEQKKMLKFTLSSREKSLDKISKEKEDVEMRLQSLRRLAHTIRSDIFTTTDTEDSETIMLKRIDISNRIERLSKLKISVSTLVEELMQVSGEWNIYLDQKSKLPKSNITESDNEKIALLRKKFIENLSRYHYRSLSSLEEIDISMESSLLPTIDGFDMKFDSSASDGVRVIWAFTLALLQVSIEKGGNHPGMIIFDEPAQQSIVPDDMKSFIYSVLELKKPFQIITAITLNSQELIEIINELDESSCSRIDIEGKAFRKLA